MGPRRAFDLSFKLRILEELKTKSLEAVSREYKVHAGSIKECRKRKSQIAQDYERNKIKRISKTSQKRLSGAGRKLISQELEVSVYNWVVDHRQHGLRVSIRSIQEYGTDLNSAKAFQASRGWAKRFLKRNGFTIRKRTTVAQKTPKQLHERLVNFVMYASQEINNNKISASNIIAMDETSLWFDVISNTTADVVGAKSVSLKSTGNEKAHATVVLAARGDGTKIKPYVVFKNAKREVKAMQGLKDAVVATSSNGWMNDELTVDWLNRVYGKFAFSTRALVWDSYKCHISESTKKHLEEFKTRTIVVPAGTTKYIQAPDVSWSKPFKDHLATSYDTWLAGTENKNYTKGGNLKAAPRSLLVEWVSSAWNSVSTELIKKSFLVCALTAKTDGSEDNEIHCFKSGQPCPEARALLNLARLEKEVAATSLEEEDDEQTELNEVVIDDDEPEEGQDSSGEDLPLLRHYDEGSDSE